MGTRNKSRNVSLVCSVARSMGAEVLSVKNSRKHHGVQICTRNGVKFWFRISQGYIEPYKQQGWTRQAIHRAERRCLTRT